MSSAADVAAARERLAGAGLATASEEGVSCCYARQDKVWVSGPSNVPWEVYTVLEDVGPEPGPGPEDATAAAGSCCGVAEAAAGDEASAAVRAPACC